MATQNRRATIAALTAAAAEDPEDEERESARAWLQEQLQRERAIVLRESGDTRVEVTISNGAPLTLVLPPSMPTARRAILRNEGWGYDDRTNRWVHRHLVCTAKDPGRYVDGALTALAILNGMATGACEYRPLDSELWRRVGDSGALDELTAALSATTKERASEERQRAAAARARDHEAKLDHERFVRMADLLRPAAEAEGLKVRRVKGGVRVGRGREDHLTVRELETEVIQVTLVIRGRDPVTKTSEDLRIGPALPDLVSRLAALG